MATRTPRWERRPDERPAELLEAALDVFARRGYRASRLEDVAEAADVTKGTIYYYFDNKEDLLRRALDHRLAGAFVPIERELARPGRTAVERLRYLVASAWRVWTAPTFAPTFQLMMGEVRTEFPQIFQAWLLEGPVHGWRLFTRVIADGQAGGEFRPDVDATALARLTEFGLLLQAVLAESLREHEPDAAGAATAPDQALATLLDVLRPRTGAASDGEDATSPGTPARSPRTRAARRA